MSEISNVISGGGVNRRHKLFSEIISVKNLLLAWHEFKRGKLKKRDVQEFVLNLEDHLFTLHDDLAQGTYSHSPYTSFFVRDPKLRHIHKPAVRDRILHHAIVLSIEPLFEPYFIFNSYSSRLGKGTHAAVAQLRRLAWHVSRNNTKTIWILQCDVRKFFDSVDHDILLRLVRRRIIDDNLLGLIERIVRSYHTTPGKGIPLGNLTSQLLSNVYLNELDQFITKRLGIQNYVRYADDIAIVGRNKIALEGLTSVIQEFLDEKLKLTLHPRKIILRKWHQGVDFLGYVVFPHYSILRTKTKRRMLRRLNQKNLQSYLGILRHCRGYGVKTQIGTVLNVGSG